MLPLTLAFSRVLNAPRERDSTQNVESRTAFIQVHSGLLHARHHMGKADAREATTGSRLGCSNL